MTIRQTRTRLMPETTGGMTREEIIEQACALDTRGADWLREHAERNPWDWPVIVTNLSNEFIYAYDVEDRPLVETSKYIEWETIRPA